MSSGLASPGPVAPGDSRAVTLIELVVGVVIGAMVLAVGYSAIGMMNRTEALIDRESTSALVESQLLEYMMRDLRSSAGSVRQLGEGKYRITRYEMEAGALVTREVTWALTPSADGQRITRTEAGRRSVEFRFTGIVDKSKPFPFKIERVQDDAYPR